MVRTGQLIKGSSSTNIELPRVFEAPLRTDVVTQIHDLMRKNKRQAHGVKFEAGYGYSAESWGTGRAVARLPRVSASGSNRATQGAFANMARGGGMFAPLVSWRKIHVKVPQKQRRLALAAAIAASSQVSLVMARGHRVEKVTNVPIIVEESAIEACTTSKSAIQLLNNLNLSDELKRCAVKHTREGHLKLRMGRTKQRTGPLIVVEGTADVAGFANIPGIDIVSVSKLSVLDLAPGGVVGRLCIWTEKSLASLEGLFGTSSGDPGVKGITLNQPLLNTCDTLSMKMKPEIVAALTK